MKPKWELAGVFTVDSGLCWIGDPCYVLHQVHSKDATIDSLREPKPKPKDIGEDWISFARKVGNKLYSRIFEEEGFKPDYQFNHDKGHPGLGVCLPTGDGDGTYEVWIKKDEGVVKEVKIKFI